MDPASSVETVRRNSAARLFLIDVSNIIENQKPTLFVARLIFLTALTSFFDGFDMNALFLCAPEIAKDLQLNRLMMGNVFSAGLAGMVVGGLLFGYLGDRIGRRPAIVVATSSFGLLTVSLALTHSYPGFMALRFVQGIGIGGLLPLTWVLNTDYVPRRFQATVVTLVTVGHALGNSFAGPMSIWLAPMGWQSVFVFGGCGTLAVAALLFAFLPESIRYLVNKNKHLDLVAKFTRKLAPDRDIQADDRFLIGGCCHERRNKFSISVLFQNDLRWITPLLWVAYIVSSVALFFRFSWGPTILQSMGFSRSISTYTTSINSLAGAIGGLLLMRFTDSRGARSIAAFAILSVPLLLTMGLGAITGKPLLAFYLFSTVFLVGAHFGLLSIAAATYPSINRSSGAGWASSVGKIGSVIGPLLGGIFLSSRLPTRMSFVLVGICASIVSAAIFKLGSIQAKAFVGKEPVNALASRMSKDSPLTAFL